MAAPGPEEIRRKQDKPGAGTEAERVENERDALIAGLTREVGSLYDKLDQCEQHLMTLILAIKKLGADQRRLTRTVDKSLLPPGLANGHD